MQISDSDIKNSLDKVLENFNSKSNMDKVYTIVKIFEVLVEKPIKETDSKWLEVYLKERYKINDLTKLEYRIQKYDNATVFQKIEILLDFDSISDVSNGAYRVSFSKIGMCFVFLLLIFQ